MNTVRQSVRSLACALAAVATVPLASAQPFGGFGGPRGGRGGGFTPEARLLDQFDRDGNGRLNKEERATALQTLAANPNGRGRRGGRGGFGGNAATPEPGIPLSADDVPAIAASVPLYDPDTIHTFFLEFEDSNWEEELSAFADSDIELPATLTVDHRKYEDVGVHFRGASSLFTVGAGYKRSLNLSIDWVKKNQDLKSYNTLNLLNAHVDPTFLRTVLFLQIAREYIPAPKANFVRVAINGENWGIYINQQQFNKDFLREWFPNADGTRWHVPGSPNGRGSLAYLGDDPAPYRRIYEIKSADSPEAWTALINLTRVLNQTPPDRLEAELSPILDIDGALKFLALENALVNNDGYWIRTSDYGIYLDTDSRFHVIPHDANETFARVESGRGGIVSGEFELDPLRAANDPGKPLLSRLLAVPALRQRYLGYVREIAQKWLDWNTLGPIVERYHAMIADDVARDTRKLYSSEAFRTGITSDVSTGGFGGGAVALRRFAEERRAYLLRVTAP